MKHTTLIFFYILVVSVAALGLQELCFKMFKDQSLLFTEAQKLKRRLVGIKQQ